MGGLSIHPDGDQHIGGAKLAERVVTEDGGLVRAKGEKTAKYDHHADKEKKEKKKMKMAGFDVDTTYPRTVGGFVRLLQVLLLLVATVCLLIGAEGLNGPFIFYLLFLVFGMVISFYFFFTIVTGRRGDEFCGCSWKLLELCYFLIFGFLLFIGACLAASNANGAPPLTAAAVFGFFTIITYIYCIWTSWKTYKKKDEAEVVDEEAGNMEEWEGVKPPEPEGVYPLDKFEEVPEERASYPIEKNNSLPVDLNTCPLYENTKTPLHRRRGTSLNNSRRHKRGHSISDKDSAFSDDNDPPSPRALRRRSGSVPSAMRRSRSGYNFGREKAGGAGIEELLNRQPLSHMSRRPYASRMEGFSRDGRDSFERGYPTQLSVEPFAGDNRKPSQHRFDNLHRSGRRKSMPEWLRAALGDDVAPDNMVDDFDDSDDDERRRRRPQPPVKRFATMPSFQHREFPLLNTSEEESVLYPSISQQPSNHHSQFHSLQNPVRHHRRSGRRHNNHRLNSHAKQRMLAPHQQQQQRHRSHGAPPEEAQQQQQQRGNHLRHSHRRRNGSHHRQHHQHHPKQPQQQAANGHQQQHPSNNNNHNQHRRPVNGAHEDYLRKMMEDDEVFMHDGSSGNRLQSLAAPRDHGKPIDAGGGRRLVPDQPASFQFPVQSRWEDEPDGNDMDNPIMEKYFANMH